MRNCPNCQTIMFNIDHWRKLCLDCWNLKNNIPTIKTKEFGSVHNFNIERNFEDSILSILDTEMDSLGLKETIRENICIICKCSFETNIDEENWKKKCLQCYKIQRNCFPIEIEFDFFKNLLDLTNLIEDKDYYNRRSLIRMLYYKNEYFKLYKKEFIKVIELDKLITEFINNFEEKGLLEDIDKKYLYNLKHF